MTENIANVDNLQECLALFALGALTDAEAQELNQQIAADASLQSEAEVLQNIAQELAFSSDEATPSPNVRAQLLANIAAENSPRIPNDAIPYTADKTHHDVRSSEGEWINLYPGIFCKTLFVEPTNGYITTLMKIEPGARVPNHHHRGAEQCLVISGEIEMNERHYKTGDFTVMLAGSDHLDLQSKTGAMVLLISPPEYQPSKA